MNEDIFYSDGQFDGGGSNVSYLYNSSQVFHNSTGSRTGQGNDLASSAADQAVTQSPSSGHPHSLNLSAVEWVAVMGGVVAFWVILSIFLACFCGPDFVTCYLCQQQIPREYWLNGEHRNECANEKSALLESLPKAETSRCPLCFRPFKVWPADLGPKEFVCQSPRQCKPPLKTNKDGTILSSSNTYGISKKPHINDGTNRYNCFNCDFDMCSDCAVEMENYKKNGTGSFATVMKGNVHKSPSKSSNFPFSQSSKREKNGSIGGARSSMNGKIPNGHAIPNGNVPHNKPNGAVILDPGELKNQHDSLSIKSSFEKPARRGLMRASSTMIISLDDDEEEEAKRNPTAPRVPMDDEDVEAVLEAELANIRINQKPISNYSSRNAMKNKSESFNDDKSPSYQRLKDNAPYNTPRYGAVVPTLDDSAVNVGMGISRF